MPFKKTPANYAIGKMFDAIGSLSAERAVFERLGVGEGGHTTLRDPGIEGGLEVDNSYSRWNCLLLEEQHSSMESTCPVPYVDRHIPSHHSVSDFVVDILCDLACTFIFGEENVHFFLQALGDA